jgi:hypothetical protein
MAANTQYLITIGEPNGNDSGVMSDEWEETFITVGRFIEKFHKDEKYVGQYIYVTEYVLSENGTNYVTNDELFHGRYLIE